MKYSRERLAAMANTALLARRSNQAHRRAMYRHLVAACSRATGLSTGQVGGRIELLSMGVPTP